MHFFVAVLSGCLLQAGDVVSSSASSLCLLKAHQLAGDKAVTSPRQSFVSSGPQSTLWTPAQDPLQPGNHHCSETVSPKWSALTKKHTLVFGCDYLGHLLSFS